MNALEFRDQTRRSDAQDVGPFEIRFTDPAAWLESLKADVALEAVADSIVWLSITTGPATLQQVKGAWCVGGEREVHTFASRYVSAHYIARGQLQSLSAYCGVVSTQGEPVGFAREISEATALRLQEQLRKVQAGLSKYRQLQVRSGGAPHHSIEDGWQAHPEEGIEVPPEMVCATCETPIYWANNAWRHSDTGHAEVYVDGLGRGNRRIKQLGHLADPDEPEKKL